jgi:hypothetical protein
MDRIYFSEENCEAVGNQYNSSRYKFLASRPEDLPASFRNSHLPGSQ